MLVVHNIQDYIDKAKELHFTPILITEIERRYRLDNGKLWHARGYFPKWMKDIALDNDLRVLDLNKKSYDEYSKYTNKQWSEMFTDCVSRKKDDHKEFEKVFGNFILGKSEIRSK